MKQQAKPARPKGVSPVPNGTTSLPADVSRQLKRLAFNADSDTSQPMDGFRFLFDNYPIPQTFPYYQLLNLELPLRPRDANVTTLLENRSGGPPSFGVDSLRKE